jgi:hypothetical protein
MKMKSNLVLAVVVLLFVFSLWASEFTFAEDWIAFQSDIDGDLDIWAIQPDGNGLQQLVDMPGTQGEPHWSPDSSKIAFSSNYSNTHEIWVYDWFKGTSTRIYTGSDHVSSPAWSPDGQRILFDEGYSSPDIFIMNKDGTNVQRVPVQEGYTMWPSWSPLEDSFVYHRRSGGHSLWVYDFSMTGDILDTNNYDQPLAPVDTHQADWGANGKVVLMWDYNIAVLNPGSPGDWGDPSAPEFDLLTTDASYPSLSYTSPCWSPDPNNAQIAFTRESTTQDLWIMNVDGSNAHVLLATANQEERPDWGNPPIPEPDIDVSPLSHDFGDVEIGTSSTVVITISNLGNGDLNVSGIALETDFAITSVPPASIVVEPNETKDVEITYTPSALGYNSAVLKITSDDPDEPVVEVALGAVGIEIPLPPLEQIANILAFFDESVEQGTLQGCGVWPCMAKMRLKAFRHMIKATSDLIDGEWYGLACLQLKRILLRCDDEPWPPDFVQGEAVPQLVSMVQELRDSLGCE